MKTTNRSIFTLLLYASGVFTGRSQTAPNATISTPVIAESSVQYATGATPTTFTNYVSGYDKVKFSATSPCKSYLKFDFTGQNPNTNYLLKFSFPTISNNGKTHFFLWALNQSYPGFVTNNPSLTWSNAQANFTGNAESGFTRLLTNGTFSATLLNDFIGNGGSGGVGGSIQVPWGKYLFNNQIVIALTASNDVANAADGSTGTSANGARLSLNAATATFQPLTVGNQPPTISTIPNQTVVSTTASSSIGFTVADVEDTPASLTNIGITLGNTNVTLTSSSITSGSGGACVLSFVPVSNLSAGQTASATVTVVVTDSAGNSASTAFQLMVPPLIPLPLVVSGTNLNYLSPTNRIGLGSVAIPFQIVDTNIPASSLIVTGAISAYSTNLGSISFSSAVGVAPNTNNCTLTVNAIGTGVGIVNVSVIDPVNLLTNNIPVAIMVLPDGSYAACDYMVYQPSTSISSSGGHADLFTASANLWAPRSVNGSVNLITSTANGYGYPSGVPMIRGSSSGNPNQVRLAGAPYSPASHKVLFASVLAQWVDASVNGANQVYPGNSAGGFLEFAADGAATSVVMAQVCTVTNVANTSTNDGSFYLGLYNGTNFAPVVDTDVSQSIPNFLSSGVLPGSPVNIVISYDLDSGVSKMWLNQADSSGNSVNLQDVAITNLANVNYLVLRQNANMGNILIEGVSVKAVAKTGLPSPAIVGVSQSGANLRIKFTSTPGQGSYCSVVGSPNVSGPFANDPTFTVLESPAGTYTATGTITGSSRYFKIAQFGGGTVPTVAFPF